MGRQPDRQTDRQAGGQLDRGAPCSCDGSIVISRRTDRQTDGVCPALGLCLWAFYALFYLHSFVCVCTEIEAATRQRASASASVLLNWQKSVARLTAYNEEGRGGGRARKTIDGQSEEGSRL